MLAPRAQSTISSTSSHCRAIRNRIQKRRHWTTARYSQFSCLSFCHTSSRRGQRELSPEVCLAIQDPCQRCMRPPCCLSVSVTVSWKHRDKSHRAHVDFVPRSLFCFLKDQEQQRKKKTKVPLFSTRGERMLRAFAVADITTQQAHVHAGNNPTGILTYHSTPRQTIFLTNMILPHTQRCAFSSQTFFFLSVSILPCHTS